MDLPVEHLTHYFWLGYKEVRQTWLRPDDTPVVPSIEWASPLSPPHIESIDENHDGYFSAAELKHSGFENKNEAFFICEYTDK